ncbi:MAG TPA: DUF5329 family protein [Candidatus Binatia bacterium]|nr:DUF5329 family protein [Candidatus Binatia bacterium]
MIGNSALMKHLSRAVVLLLIFSGSYRWVQGETIALSEKQKIEALIRRVAASKDLTFIRNGTPYDAAKAAAFLRRKWEANDSKVKTARDFIGEIASFSGTSGKPYLIRLNDGRELRSRDFLLAELQRIEDNER